MNDDAPFGYWLKKAREALDLTQSDLAGRIGCSTITVRKIEAGERRPSSQVAALLADCFCLVGIERTSFLRFARGERPALLPVLPPHTAATAPWRRSALLAAPLPAPATPLVGREQEVLTIQELFRSGQTRLVTLTGPGGVGKTRLALKAASGLKETFRDGVSFVPLATITNPRFVVSSIGHALGVRESGHEPLLVGLKNVLRDKQVLLVLDNFEQIVPAGTVIAELLSTAPGLRVLITSRAVLHLTGEQVCMVEPLGLPDPRNIPGPLKLNRYPSVELFVQRVQAVMPDFRLTDANAQAVAEICVRLEGMPLALELAAARSKLLPPQALLARLQNRLAFLATGLQDLPERQQTLRATIGWSYDLLNAAEQTLFRRLAIFSGGHTVAAAEAVCGGDELIPDVLAGLQSLADRSLLRTSGSVETRLTMMEAVRDFALEQLETGGEISTIRQRHATFYLSMAEAADADLIGPHEASWLDRLDVDHENLRKMLEWAIAERAIELGLRTAVALRRFWVLRGFLAEGATWFERLLAQAEATAAELAPLVYGRAYAAAGNLAHHVQDVVRARHHLERALEFLPEGDAAKERAWALANLGWMAMDEGAYLEAAVHFEQGLALNRAVRDVQGCAEILSFQGYLELRQGKLEAASRLFAEGLALAEQIGDSRGVADALYELADIARDQANYDQAWSLYPRCVEIFRELGDRERIAWCLHAQCEMALLQGDYERALGFSQESLTLFEDLGHRFGCGLVLHNRGYIELRQNGVAQAITPFMASVALYHEMGNTWGMALSLTGPARVAVEVEPGPDGARRAARLLGAAAAKRESISARPSHYHDFEIRQTCALASEYLDRTEFAAAWVEGRELNSDQVLSLAQSAAAPLMPTMSLQIDSHRVSL